jgi:hypothetical protein
MGCLPIFACVKKFEHIIILISWVFASIKWWNHKIILVYGLDTVFLAYEWEVI